MSTSSRIIAAGVFGILLSARTSTAQSSQSHGWERRVTSGAFVPTGDQRDALQHAQASAAQVAWRIRPSLAVTSTFTWARSRDVASIDTPKLDVFTSDVGIEQRGRQWFASHAVTFSPFAGIGAGARSYNYRRLDVDAVHNLAGYGAVGGELGFKRVGLRLEVRDYTSGFKPLVGAGRSDVRNDVVIMAGLRLRKHHASQN
jgi:hypothetical protein